MYDVSVFIDFRSQFITRWRAFRADIIGALKGREARWETVNVIGFAATVVGTAVLIVISANRTWFSPTPTMFDPPPVQLLWPLLSGLALSFGWYHEVHLQRSIKALRPLLGFATLAWFLVLLFGSVA